MVKQDFIDCEFVNEYLRFITYEDFCKNCQVIKGFYIILTEKEKRFYKWYVYANIFIDEVRKNIIWEYLNYDEPEYYQKLLRMRRRIQ